MLAQQTEYPAPTLMTARCAYDVIAPHYELWRWFKFWRLNEAPRVSHWLEQLTPGLGLDAGAGTGPYLPVITRLGHRCIATDISARMLSVNRQKTRNNQTPGRYIQAHIDALPFQYHSFDWILCSRVLSHVRQLQAILLEFARVLKSGGECLIADVHPDHPYDHVAIPVAGQEIAIETYKHSLLSFNRALSAVPQLQLVDLHEYYLGDLAVRPSRTEFAKLYRHPDSAVFYTCLLKKI